MIRATTSTGTCSGWNSAGECWKRIDRGGPLLARLGCAIGSRLPASDLPPLLHSGQYIDFYKSPCRCLASLIIQERRIHESKSKTIHMGVGTWNRFHRAQHVKSCRRTVGPGPGSQPEPGPQRQSIRRQRVLSAGPAGRRARSPVWRQPHGSPAAQQRERCPCLSRRLQTGLPEHFTGATDLSKPKR